MPYAVYVLLYLLLEALAFWGVSQLVGVGWALFGVFALMIIGAFAASGALRRELHRASAGRTTIGQFAGGTALVAAGWALAVVPGYLTSVIGAVLLFGPTRELVRTSMAASLNKRVEQFGAQVYDAAGMRRRATSYGSFGSGTGSTDVTGQVIDESEIEQWSRDAKPEDFGETPGDGNSNGDARR